MPVSLLTASIQSPPPLPPSPATGQAPTSILRRESVATSEADSERGLTFAIAAPRVKHSGPPLRLPVFEDSDTPFEDDPSVSIAEYPFARPTHYRGRQPAQATMIPDRVCSRHRSPPPRARASSERPRRFHWIDSRLPSADRRGSVPAVVFTGRRGSGHQPERPTFAEPLLSPRTAGSNAPPTVDSTPATASSISPQIDSLCARLGSLARGGSLSESRRAVERRDGV